jgi:hypothetical protein
MLLHRTFSVNKDEIIKAKLGTQKAFHVHSVGIQRAKKDLIFHRKTNEKS